MKRLVSVVCVFFAVIAQPAAAQMDHSAMHKAEVAAQGAPSQAAFATISEIVRKLKADPSTDWSKVNIEALRQHLIDMDNVVMRSSVKQSNVEGGVSLDITGTGAVAGAIKRMGAMHAHALSEEGVYAAKASDIENGIRLVITAQKASDVRLVAQIRALGFAGLMTEGDHHAMHHMEMARGGGMMHHRP
jgi:ribose 5-phosphate isomerase RpiB